MNHGMNCSVFVVGGMERGIVNGDISISRLSVDIELVTTSINANGKVQEINFGTANF